jgi:hypothetical protein
VPAKPSWYSKLDEVIRELQRLPRPFVDRATLEALLGVSRRRAQEILAPCVTDRVGSNGLADRDSFVIHLRHVAEGDAGYYEKHRRKKVAAAVAELRKDRIERPLLVAAPVEIVNQQFGNLPDGVSITPGYISVSFESAIEAPQKLLALSMAIRNDELLFERLATGTPPRQNPL